MLCMSKSIAAQTPCVDCAPGEYATSGKASCSTCNPGQEPDKDQTKCLRCPDGKFSFFGKRYETGIYL